MLNRRRAQFIGSSFVAAALLAPNVASAAQFEAGSLIIPMDTTYQNMGMFRAYGLVYELLRNDITVHWVIRGDKLHNEVDFTASATDVTTNAVINMHGYRGGPWVVDAADAIEAIPIIEAWIDNNPQVRVHEASAAFDGEISRTLVVAPTIAMVADGNQSIARGYMLAAGIPDSVLNLAWPDNSPDMLSISELAGVSNVNHADGALFDEDGDPVYCQLMSMHWGVNNAQANPEVVAEVRQFLNNPVHFFAECQAVNAFENLAPHGFFLTPNGFLIGQAPGAVTHLNHASPYHQMDGTFGTVGGSERSYTLPGNDEYLAGGVTMITSAASPVGVNDVWMTGFLDGACPPLVADCGTYGKISYLGGHQYSTNLPITNNPQSQGVRLFLNSMFEAPCATIDGLPELTVVASAPAFTMVPTVDVDIDYSNVSHATALSGFLRAPLPANTMFVSATQNGALIGNDVVWDLGNLGPQEAGNLGFTMELADYGLYESRAYLDYEVGLNGFTLASNIQETLYADEPPGDGDGDGDGDTNSGDGDGDTNSGDGDGDGDGDTNSGDGDGDTNSGDGDGDPGDGDTNSGDGAGESADDDGGNADGATDGGTGTGNDPFGNEGLDGGGCSCATHERDQDRDWERGAPIALFVLLFARGRRSRRLAGG